jgi:hypothetical protein
MKEFVALKDDKHPTWGRNKRDGKLGEDGQHRQGKRPVQLLRSVTKTKQANIGSASSFGLHSHYLGRSGIEAIYCLAFSGGMEPAPRSGGIA